MPWNPNTHCLTWPFTKLGKDGQGDLQLALHCTDKSEKDVFANGVINKMAKYKAQIIPGNPIAGSAADRSLTDAERVALLYGLSVVKCGRLDYPSRYDEPWAYNRPVFRVNPIRPVDFVKNKSEQDVGYQDSTPWSAGAVSAGMLWTIFGGSMGVTGAQVAPGDRVYFNMQCKENDEIDPYLGLLYPADFAGAINGFDLSTYYLGIAIIDANDNVWIYSDPHISDYLSGLNVYCGVDVTLPATGLLAFGPAIIAPVLTSTRQDSWTLNYDGNIVNLDGAYLPVTIVRAGSHVKYEVEVNVGANSTEVEVTVTNETGSNVTISPMVGYLLSGYADMNEYETPGTGPDFRGEGTRDYIYRRWNLRPPEYKQGDIYSHDWEGGYYQPIDALAARYLDLYAAFVAANGGSNVLAPSSPGSPNAVTFTVQVNATGDDFGSYSTEAPVLYILSDEGGIILIRQFVNQ